MALINCPNCGKTVSDKAVKCPHCGVSLRPETLSVKSFGLHKAWLLVLISVLALWGVYCLDVLELKILNDDYATRNAGDYYTYTMSAFLIAIVIATLLVTINICRKPIKICFYITLVTAVALIFAGSYDRFNPSDSNGKGQFSLACYYEYHGDFKRALDLYIETTWCGDDQPYSAKAYNAIGELYAKGEGVEKNIEDAIQFFQKAIEISEAQKLTLVQVSSHKNLGQAFWEQNRLQEAVAQFQKALQLEGSESMSYEAKAIRELLQNITKEITETTKNFCTKDLSAFLLHGKVKIVTYHSGLSFSRCTFNELGSLIKYEIGDNHNTHQYTICHEGNNLLLSDELGSWVEVYEVDDENRLVKYESSSSEGFGSRYLYYYHDSNNCPLIAKSFTFDIFDNSSQEGQTIKLTYSDIDEYGNWLTKTDHNDEILERRIIEYYSMATRNADTNDVITEQIVEESDNSVNIFGTYEFSDGIHIWELVLNEDETCTVRDKSVDGPIIYGSWNHWTYSEKEKRRYSLKFTDMSPTIWFDGDEYPSELRYPVFDIVDSYIYANENACDSKNPRKRFSITKVN